MRIEFTVPAVPVAQPRAKATTVNGYARMYAAGTKHPIHAFKACVRLAAAEAFSGAPFLGPLRLSAVFVFPRPKGLIWKTKPMPRCPAPSSRCGDFDNLIKGLADSLTGLVWGDDSQIVAAAIVKEYAAGDEQPHVQVIIEELT